MDPSHITEFASPRYFDKLRSLNEAHNIAAEDSGAGVVAATTIPLPFEHAQLPQSHSQHSAFSLPFHTRPHRRRRSDDTERSGDGPKRRNVQTGKEQLATRKQSFTSSIAGSFKFKIPHSKSSPAQLGPGHLNVEASPFFTHEEEAAVVVAARKPNLSLGDRFLALPNELQLAIVAPLPMPTILNLRLVSRQVHTLISLNEGPITRYHLANSVPHYALKLYPVPDASLFTLQYLSGLWHRLHVSAKLADLIAEQTTNEWFNRTTLQEKRDFAPHMRRMRVRLQPLLFTMFHFFEKYRELHLAHLQRGGTPLKQQNIPPNPIEKEIMYLYDAQTLLHLHEIMPLVLSAFSRSLRPPSFIGKLERTMKGYFYNKPSDEVYATILLIGGLRQVSRFWSIEGYNSRRAEVDRWYSGVTKEPLEVPVKSKFSLLGMGRKKKMAEVTEVMIEAVHDPLKCKKWDCVSTQCVEKRGQRPVWREDLVFHTSLAAGPPMKPLDRQSLRLLLDDQQPLQGERGIWMQTGERVILERGIIEAVNIKRNTQVLLELIKEEGASELNEWSPGLSQAPTRPIAPPAPTDPPVNGFQSLGLRDM